MSALDALLRTITALPVKGTPAADLTERDKLALCIAAGVEVDTQLDAGGRLEVRTKKLCGITDRGDGGWIVGVAA